MNIYKDFWKYLYCLHLYYFMPIKRKKIRNFTHLGGRGGGDGDLFWPGPFCPPGPPDDRDWQCFNMMSHVSCVTCHAGRITAGSAPSMQQMLIRASHESYWDARYIRCEVLGRAHSAHSSHSRTLGWRATHGPGTEFHLWPGAGPGVPDQRHCHECHDVTQTRGHVSRVSVSHLQWASSELDRICFVNQIMWNVKISENK